MHIWIGESEKKWHVEEFPFRIGGRKKIWRKNRTTNYIKREIQHAQSLGVKNKRESSDWLNYYHVYDFPEQFLD